MLTAVSHLGQQALELMRRKNTQVSLPPPPARAGAPRAPFLPLPCCRGPAGPREPDAMCLDLGRRSLPACPPRRLSVCGARPLTQPLTHLVPC